MTKRPSVLSLDDLMRPKVEPEPIAEPAPPPVEPEQPQPEPVKAEDPPAAAVDAAPAETPVADAPADKGARAFRTSLYFHRSVHDVLRDIAHAERKNVSDLINEGLDHVLKVRKLPTTAELRNGAKAS